MLKDREYCAEIAAAEGEALGGTADVVDVWIMLEYRPSWSSKATSDNALAPRTRAWLDELAASAAATGRRTRVQFVRRPELEHADLTLMVALDGRLHRCAGPNYDALGMLAFDDVLRAPIETAPQYFVCTNGQRDVCCARFGLPAYAALRESVGARAWQTTHVGGHRFAPNVLTLPQAALYGRVHPHDVGAFVAHVESGRLATAWLRGRTRHAPEVQAAEATLAARGTDTSVEPATRAIDGGWEVRFGDAIVHVCAQAPRAVLASCGDARKPVASWRVTDPA